MTERQAAYEAEVSTPSLGERGRFVPDMDLALLVESKNNPRKRYDEAALADLAESIRTLGVITPVLVRPIDGGRYEIAAGHRRCRAARLAGLTTLPVVWRDMSDEELLEVLVIENDQREDVHPLEEAGGYHALLAQGPQYDVARIAGRIGRSVKYVYDRLKLLQLTPAAQKLFLEDRFTAAHAILLARLTPEKQAEALEVEHGSGGLFTHEGRDLFDDDPDVDDKIDSDPYYGSKPRSVREFETWINRNVRADRRAVDPILFPETATLVSGALEKGEKVIPITHLSQRPDAARTGDKVLTGAAWKRADGARDSKTCTYSELGVIEIGPAQHEAFLMCRKKDRCTVHWGSEIKDRQARQKAAETATASGKDPRKAERDTYAEQERRRKEAEAQEESRRARWRKATPALLAALAEAVKGAPTKADGLLARTVLGRVSDSYHSNRLAIAAGAKLLGSGKTADDVLRHAAYLIIASQAANDWQGPRDFPKTAKAFGIDVGKILNQAAPVEKPKPAVQTSAQAAGEPKKAKRGGAAGR